MENSLREYQLVCLGKLLAGYTHELKNHLAIINESSGLMHDLLEMSEGADENLHQRFNKIIATIGGRISRANCMAGRLNSLAHRMDASLSHCNLNDLLTELLALMERFGAMKNISFDKDLHQDLPSFYTNPSLLQCIIFSLVSELLEKLAGGSVIQFSSHAKGEGVELRIESAGRFAGDGEREDAEEMSHILHFALEQMDMHLERKVSAGQYLKIILTIPSTIG